MEAAQLQHQPVPSFLLIAKVDQKRPSTRFRPLVLNAGHGEDQEATLRTHWLVRGKRRSSKIEFCERLVDHCGAAISNGEVAVNHLFLLPAGASSS
jgi:hypothetical protein